MNINNNNFVGRENEVKRILYQINRNRQNNVLIYGRRIGKSTLLQHIASMVECKVVFFQALDVNERTNIEELQSIITNSFEFDYHPHFNNIKEILTFLFERKEKIVLILDDYPFLSKRIDGLDSILQERIDHYKHSSNTNIIVSGSEIEFMKNLLNYSSPLFGRFSEIIELKEHNYYEASLFYPTYSNEDKVLLYSVFGGEPFYNSKINTNLSAMKNIMNLAIKENSLLELGITLMLAQELSRLTYANDILLAIALGAKRYDDIASIARVQNNTKIYHTLSKLITLGLVSKVSPINDQDNKKKASYLISSNPVKFYYKYIYRFVNKRHQFINFFSSSTEEYKDFKELYISSIFKDISKQFLLLANKKDKRVDFNEIGTYSYSDVRNRKNGQFDIVTKDAKGYIFYEVKYTDTKIENNIANEEQLRLSELGICYYNLGFISKTSFDNIENKCIKITLDDMYKEIK